MSRSLSAAAGLSGHGSLQMWGMSPAKNLLDFIIKGNNDSTSASERKKINILLFGESDLRHSLRTLASNWAQLQSNELRLNFYVVENSLDLYTRQLILWSLALEAKEEKGLHEKTIQFMDLFGNLYIKPQTKKYLLNSIEKLIKLITDDEKMLEEFPMFNFSLLKYRERDQMVEILKYWSKNMNSTKMDLAKIWDTRLRQYLGTRYDSRAGVFDWDYNMNLLEKGPNMGLISIQEYKYWRNNGIAFGEFEADYSQPNLTLTSGATTPNHNYWGDILTGPFISHGLECDKPDYFSKSQNNVYKNKSFDVSKYNLDQIFTTISSSTVQERVSFLQSSAFSINFISPSNLKTMVANEKFLEHFHLVYFANSMVQYLKMETNTTSSSSNDHNNLRKVMAENCVVIIENASFVLEFKQEQAQLFNEKIEEIASNVGLEKLESIASKSNENELKELEEVNCFKTFYKNSTQRQQ